LMRCGKSARREVAGGVGVCVCVVVLDEGDIETVRERP